MSETLAPFRSCDVVVSGKNMVCGVAPGERVGCGVQGSAPVALRPAWLAWGGCAQEDPGRAVSCRGTKSEYMMAWCSRLMGCHPGFLGFAISGQILTPAARARTGRYPPQARLSLASHRSLESGRGKIPAYEPAPGLPVVSRRWGRQTPILVVDI
jgi:hypothetical protein